MATLTYDGANNIEQTIATGSIGSNFGPGVAVSPLTNAAVNGNASPIAAPNAFGTTSRDLSPKTSAFSVNSVVAGTIISVATNPA